MSQHEPTGDLIAGGDGHGEKKPGFFGRILVFIRQVIAEIRKVVTPTKNELITYTLVVLGFVAVMMALVWGLDVVFVWLTTWVFGTPGA